MTYKLVLATYALLSIFIIGGAAVVWIRRKAAAMRGHPLPRARIF